MPQSRFAPAVSPHLLFDYRYDLVEYLGGGHFGEVWRAIDTSTGRQVALKLIDPSQSLPDDAWQEATRLTSLESKYTAVVHGAALSEVGIPYIDMQYISGGSVGGALPEFGVDEITARDWTVRAARGLQLCHERRLLHRDVKPDNLLLSGVGQVLLGDFGITAMMGQDGTADAHGDIEILAPEVFQGRCSVQSDVYSLGVTLYAMVTGHLPHRFGDFGLDMDQMEKAVKAGVADVRSVAPHLSLGIARVIGRATAVDPDTRFDTAHDLDTALSRLSTPTAAVRQVSPCAATDRCWEVSPKVRTKKAIHVCTRPIAGRVHVETRRQSGNRLKAHCGVVTAGQATARLKAIFRALLG